MSRSQPRLLTLLLCFLLSFTLAITHIFWPLSTAVATETTPVLGQASAQQRGRQLYEAGQLSEAITTWENISQTLFEQGDTLNQASILSNLALAYQQLNDWERAQATINHSLELLHSVELSNSPQTASIFAQVWNTQGNLALLRSQTTQALTAFEQATDYYTQADDSSGILRSQINQAQTLQALGFYRRAVTTLTELSLSHQPDAPTKVTGLQLLGDLQRLIGNLDASHTTLNEAHIIAQALDSETLAAVELSLGHTTQAEGDVETALEHYQQAATTAETAQLKLRSELSQWSLLIETGHELTADRLYRQIQAELTALPVSRVTVNTHLELARQRLDLPMAHQQVAEELAIARQQAITLKDARAESYALGYLGQLYLEQQQWQDSQTLLKQALTIAENINAPDLAYQWHWRLAQLQRQQGQYSAAITSYENSVSHLQSLRSNLIAIAPDLRFDFREQVEPVYREWVDLLLTEAKTSTPAQQSQLSKARQAIESLQLAELENFFQEPCVPISQEIDQVIENADSPTAVLYPIILPDRLEILLKLPQQPLRQYTAQVSQNELESLLTKLQRNLLLPYTLKQVQAESKQLYDWLILPTETALETSQVDTLVFVLDGFLRSIPMAALYDGQQYLVEKYSIALAPGLQLVDPQPLQQRELATIIAGLSASRHGFSELPSVKDEVDQIQASTPSRVLFNESFTAANLETAINNTSFPLVHLATHGQFSSDPNQTFVLAWDKPIEMNTLNRLLRQGEHNRQSAIELLILSACETAAGDKRAALGLAGVAVQAGARSTLASLWNLDDASGAHFSNLFYQELKTPNVSKAQALRNAQLQLLQYYKDINPNSQHLQFWAPYVLLGNWL